MDVSSCHERDKYRTEYTFPSVAFIRHLIPPAGSALLLAFTHTETQPCVCVCVCIAPLDTILLSVAELTAHTGAGLTDSATLKKSNPKLPWGVNVCVHPGSVK